MPLSRYRFHVNFCVLSTGNFKNKICGTKSQFLISSKSSKLIVQGLNYKIHQGSGSQPGCRGTLGCREIVSRVPPVIHFINLQTYFSIQECRQILIQLTKGAARQKRLRNTALGSHFWYVPITKCSVIDTRGGLIISTFLGPCYKYVLGLFIETVYQLRGMYG